MAVPCVLLASCSQKCNIAELVKQILDVDKLSDPSPVLESIVSYPWSVNTKYYTADVRLCTTTERTIGDEQFAANVEAFVAYFDTTEISSFDQVKMWLTYLDHIAPSVQLLVCDRLDEHSAKPRRQLIEWCLEHEFELIELNPAASESDDDSDVEDIFKETVGVKRIVEALSCHSWSNMILKEKPTHSPYMQELINSAAASEENNKEQNEESPSVVGKSEEAKSVEEISADGEASVKLKPEIESNGEVKVTNGSGDNSISKTKEENFKKDDLVSNIIDGLLGGDDGGLDEGSEDSFEKLFEKLQTMKASAGTMSFEERKKYAEQVTLQFWEAIGGNKEEIEGISDDET